MRVDGIITLDFKAEQCKNEMKFFLNEKGNFLTLLSTHLQNHLLASSTNSHYQQLISFVIKYPFTLELTHFFYLFTIMISKKVMCNVAMLQIQNSFLQIIMSQSAKV